MVGLRFELSMSGTTVNDLSCLFIPPPRLPFKLERWQQQQKFIHFTPNHIFLSRALALPRLELLQQPYWPPSESKIWTKIYLKVCWYSTDKWSRTFFLELSSSVSFSNPIVTADRSCLTNDERTHGSFLLFGHQPEQLPSPSPSTQGYSLWAVPPPHGPDAWTNTIF